MSWWESHHLDQVDDLDLTVRRPVGGSATRDGNTPSGVPPLRGGGSPDPKNLVGSGRSDGLLQPGGLPWLTKQAAPTSMADSVVGPVGADVTLRMASSTVRLPVPPPTSSTPPATSAAGIPVGQYPPVTEPVPVVSPSPMVDLDGAHDQGPHLEYAGFGRRLAALLLDVIIIVPLVMGPGAAIGALMGSIAGYDSDVLLLFILITAQVGWDLGLLAYVWVGAARGQTLGQRIVGIRVCRLDGTGLGLGRALWRNILSWLSTIPLLIGWFAPLWSPRRQTWHDSIAGTVVVRDPSARLAGRAVVWTVVWTMVASLSIGGFLLHLGQDGRLFESTYSGYYDDHDHGYDYYDHDDACYEEIEACGYGD